MKKNGKNSVHSHKVITEQKMNDDNGQKSLKEILKKFEKNEHQQ